MACASSLDSESEHFIRDAMRHLMQGRTCFVIAHRLSTVRGADRIIVLDEVNVARFRALLQELAQQTQFIIITHNRGTVEAADTIYGVSMGADGISQVVSLKLD